MFLSLSLGLANAQQFAGIATYKSDSKLNIQIDGTDRASGVDNEEMQKALRKALQKDYELHFNQKESAWKEVESLGGAPEVASGGMRIAIKANNGILYKNIQEQQSLEENDVFGKKFIDLFMPWDRLGNFGSGILIPVVITPQCLTNTHPVFSICLIRSLLFTPLPDQQVF